MRRRMMNSAISRIAWSDNERLPMIFLLRPAFFPLLKESNFFLGNTLGLSLLPRFFGDNLEPGG
jgi:hypothetical protein